MPARLGRRGQTASEPSTIAPPRLFKTARHAQLALDWWLSGVNYMHRSRSHDGEYDEIPEVDPRPDRKASDFEIASVKFTPVPVHA